MVRFLFLIHFLSGMDVKYLTVDVLPKQEEEKE